MDDMLSLALSGGQMKGLCTVIQRLYEPAAIRFSGTCLTPERMPTPVILIRICMGMVETLSSADYIFNKVNCITPQQFIRIPKLEKISKRLLPDCIRNQYPCLLCKSW
jgi:hypothetical protein